jgi:hypothetical protein
MVLSEARVATPRAARYMTQLCKHFEHRRNVSYDAAHGSIAFDSGVCSMAATGDLLVLQAAAGTEENLTRLEEVVIHHLARFAFRDKPAIEWRRAARLSG